MLNRIGSLPGVACGLAVSTVLTVSGVQAEGPNDHQPPGVIPDDELRCEPGVVCNVNPCIGDDIIVNVQNPEKCVPCLENSTANVFNRTCVCNPGYQAISIDEYYRETCKLEFGIIDETVPIVPGHDEPEVATTTVQIPAAEFYWAVAELGIQPQIDNNSMTTMRCEVFTYSGFTSSNVQVNDVVVAEALYGHSGPPPSNPSQHTCTGTLFDVTLVNGWEFHQFSNDAFYPCNGVDDPEMSITKMSSDPTEMAHQFLIRDWTAVTGLCWIVIGIVELRGPEGLHWKTALGY